jgi:hypothetical protein
MRKFLGLAALVAAGLGAVVVVPRDASACGGCFAPPENPTVVTDHRMVLSISAAETTLYDQIRYQGDPAAFAWVLPISGEATVGLSADVLFGALDAVTQTQIQAPPRFCSGGGGGCPNDGFSAGSAAADAGAAPPGVEVTKREVVGPYETVQLKATDPNALSAWLVQNNFVIPEDIKPTIAAYVNEKFDFLALKLLPGKGVSSMRPVRVTTKGASPILPLRMVAAGTGATVGITLWIVGEGRYEPQNFPFFHIETSDLVWDWATSSSNYRDLRAQKTAASQGRAWEIESSATYDKPQIEEIVESGGRRWGGFSDAAQDYLPVEGPNPKTAEQVRQEDLAALFGTIPGWNVRITRIRADLARAALDKDLLLTASADQRELSPFRRLQKDVNWPGCPTPPPVICGGDPYTDGRSDLVSGKGCSTAASRFDGTDLGLGCAAGLLGVAMVRVRRRSKTAGR